MLGYKKFLTEQKDVFKMYISKFVKGKNIKTYGAARRGRHIRFPLRGNKSDFQKFFQPIGITVLDTQKSISGLFETYLLKKTDTNDEILWVNNIVGTGTKIDRLFKTKELTPDSMGITGSDITAADIISNVSTQLKTRYPKNIADQLIMLMKASVTKNNTPALKQNLSFNKKDLAIISKDFGELLSAIWVTKKLNVSSVFFPTSANEPLVDFYANKAKIKYPISVKSGLGGRVTVVNIITAIKSRAKMPQAQYSKEPAIRIISIIEKHNAREQMIMLHKEMKTPQIKLLARLMKTQESNINIKSLRKWLDGHTTDELKTILKPLHNSMNAGVTEAIWKRDDKLRFVIAPMGRHILKILNTDKTIRNSLTSLAQNVGLMQVNIDVKKDSIKFNNNFFKKAEFHFGWAGYAAGNKMGFFMKK